MQVTCSFGQYNYRPNFMVNKKECWKGAFLMKRKLMTILGSAILSVFVMTGCNANDQDPPPEDDTNVIDDQNGNVDTGNDGDINDNNGTNDLNDMNDLNDTNDINTENDGDPMKDNNDPGEDIIEDTRDALDNDNEDE